jgi:hypothetical protein
MHIISLHPNFISLNIDSTAIQPFESVEVICMLHWSQELNCLFQSKVRVYVWELEDEETIESGLAKMFNNESDVSCLHFEEVVIHAGVGENSIQKITPVLPPAYSSSRVILPNMQSVTVTENMMNEVMSHCEKVGKVKAIYTHGRQYVVEFA